MSYGINNQLVGNKTLGQLEQEWKSAVVDKEAAIKAFAATDNESLQKWKRYEDWVVAADDEQIAHKALINRMNLLAGVR